VSRLIRKAEVIDLSPSCRAVDVENGPLLLDRGGRMFMLDAREKRVLVGFLAREDGSGSRGASGRGET
jgi:hypothetical protein